jgi:DNA-binding XRE family transcriptional regulator
MRTKKAVGKEQLRQRRAQLYDAIAGGRITLQEAAKEMRAISRLTQAGFAAHRGVSTKVIKEIEGGTGNPTVATLNRIGAFFGLEVAFVRTETLRGQRSAAPSPAVPDEQPRPLAAGDPHA